MMLQGAKSIFFLAPLLQCTSIDRCTLVMRVKNKNIILFCLVIKIMFHSLSHSVPFSLSVTPSEALILPQNSLKLSSSLSHSPLSSSLIHRHRPDPAIPSRSQNSHSLSSLKLPHSLPLARPSRPKLPITLDPRRSPLCLIGGGGGCMGRSASVGGWVR